MQPTARASVVHHRIWLALSALAVVGCLAAYQLGAFVRAAAPIDYERQVDAAVHRGDWTTPPASNVVDLTRAATDAWPSSDEVHQLRVKVATLLAKQARNMLGKDELYAKELAQAAHEFEPGSVSTVELRSLLASPGGSEHPGAAVSGLSEDDVGFDQLDDGNGRVPSTSTTLPTALHPFQEPPR